MPSEPPLAPGGRPLIGHTGAVLREPLAALERWGRTDDGVVRVRIAGKQLCLVTDPEAIGSVLARDQANYQKAEIVRDRLGTLQGGSLVLLEGDQWRRRREMLQSAVGGGRMASASSLTTSYTTEMVEAWPTDRPIEIADRMQTLVLSILADALFGLDLCGEETPIHKAADDILARMELRSVSTYLPEWVPTPTNLRFRRAVATLHDRLDAIVERERADGPSGETLLSVMLAAGLPAETIRDELIAFLFAGYDSTATALSCTVATLPAHPEIQSTLQDELDAVLGGQPPTPDDLSELSLLDAVVKESLRLYPPQYILFREPTTTVSLQGYRIEPGTTLVLCPWVCQRDDRFWDEPAAFRPERWLDDGTDDDRPRYAYVPYGGGPRHCLGVGLANRTLRLATAVICQRRRLRSVDSLAVTAGPTLSIDGEMRVLADRRSPAPGSEPRG